MIRYYKFTTFKIQGGFCFCCSYLLFNMFKTKLLIKIIGTFTIYHLLFIIFMGKLGNNFINLILLQEKCPNAHSYLSSLNVCVFGVGEKYYIEALEVVF